MKSLTVASFFVVVAFLVGCPAARTSSDAGLTAAVPRDAGPVPDAGPGSSPDSGTLPDAGSGPVPDSGVLPDAGEAPDSGEALEDGGPIDLDSGVSPFDAGQCGTSMPPDSGAPDVDAGPMDAGPSDTDAGSLPADGGFIGCSVDGNPGQCMDATTCTGAPSFEAVPGYCPGPANIQCCVLAPNSSYVPPVPTGWALMTQAQVTADMTTWAVDILNDPTDYPRFTNLVKVFGAQTVMARVEWHPPDFQNNVVHRGVTLYVPSP